jgi:Trypsin/PEP-CTERM motif
MGFAMDHLKKAILLGSLLTVAASAARAQEWRPDRVLGRPELGSQPARYGPLSYEARRLLVVAGSNPQDTRYATPPGDFYDGVGAIFIERTDGNFICSGALFGGGAYMLTAAHCLTDTKGQVITNSTTSVFFPGAGTREFVVGSQFWVNPLYTGEVIDAHDVAVIKLDATPSLASKSYSLFTGNPFGKQANLVGSGTSGSGDTGGTVPPGFLESDRRKGRNTVDFSWTNPAFGGFFNGFFGKADPTGLVADFDNGKPANDASCLIGGAFGTSAFCNTGLGLDEVSLGGGDSGGPLFINGQIAGVASYGLTFGPDFGDQDADFNESFGEFSGWASTEYNAKWLSQFNTSTVPEPSSLALVAVGMLVVAVGARRRSTR